MHTTIELLNEVARALGTPEKAASDYAVALKLGLTRSQISKYRSGRDFMSDDTAFKVANALGDKFDVAYIVTCIHHERAKSPGAKRVWEKIAKACLKAGAPAAVVLAALVLSSSWFDVSPLSPAAAAGTELSVLCQIILVLLAIAAQAFTWWELPSPDRQAPQLVPCSHCCGGFDGDEPCMFCDGDYLVPVNERRAIDIRGNIYRVQP